MDSDNHQHTYTFGNVNECISIFYHYSAFLQPYTGSLRQYNLQGYSLLQHFHLQSYDKFC